ncbi:uncharacterized protein K444DRAFT_217839 [Hyaloscypha bicolor E]|uniref:Uncharacterized protein n=1 Tax=Hyaloscypha bicolor E TaxID=1095630 RepID=A0A2J6SP04_9HELO|nr:uncharacterized protein K444DRAFT_217839 [Hyaloscypha bicolor E]PMD52502.1 hypothetical protein K444DRAFT_217839 [Hyaloscypha bicolor E]
MGGLIRGLLEGCWRLTGAGRTIKGPIYSKPEKGREKGHGRPWGPQGHVQQPAVTLAWTFGPAETASIELLGLRPFDLAPFLFLFLFLATGDSNRPEHPWQRQQIQHVEACAGRGVGGSWGHPVGALPFCAPSAPQWADTVRSTDILLTTDQRASLPVIRTGTVSWPPLVQALRFVWWSVVSALPDREVLKWPSRLPHVKQAGNRLELRPPYSTSESLLVALLSIPHCATMLTGLARSPLSTRSSRPLPFPPPLCRPSHPAKIGIGDGLMGSLNQSAR